MNENITILEESLILPKEKTKSWFLKFLIFIGILFALCFLLFFLLFLGTGYSSSKIGEKIMFSGRAIPTKEEAQNYDEIIKLADKTLSSVSATETFVVIDRVHNRLWLNENGQITLEAKISAGAGSILKDPKTQREWIFDTPIGRFKIKNKRERPLWTAPDWEFIEANEPYPKNYADRTEEGMLGEYALDLDIPGYMIHGTLYERLIGRNVTHGCVRVGKDDLRILWKKVPIGSTVFIF